MGSDGLRAGVVTGCHQGPAGGQNRLHRRGRDRVGVVVGRPGAGRERRLADGAVAGHQFRDPGPADLESAGGLGLGHRPGGHRQDDRFVLLHSRTVGPVFPMP